MTSLQLAAKSRLEALAAGLRTFRKNQSGAALVEYALLIGLMAVCVIAAAGALTPQVKTAFGKVGTQLTQLK
ncbi:Flp family type IVb pilin [Phenylobacterium sp.]|uniref:Flp family type IVb pilin n=1 Tax=Phenylobacterium sp. TaxID=1871053 RepID=UPI0035B09654